jgi:DNA-binding transcriptional regulator Cro
MTPQQVWDYYGSSYKFHKKTGMSNASIVNWMKWGYVPEDSQYRLERLTKGELKREPVIKKESLKEEEQAFNYLLGRVTKVIMDFINKYPHLALGVNPDAISIVINVLHSISESKDLVKLIKGQLD